jgi:hypothetical protein
MEFGAQQVGDFYLPAHCSSCNRTEQPNPTLCLTSQIVL